MTATPATKKYADTFRRLTAVGWTLRNYGHGWRYFARPVEGAAPAQPPNSHPDAPATMRLHEWCRVNTPGTITEVLESQYLA